MRPYLIGGRLDLEHDSACAMCVECHRSVWLAPGWETFIEERRPLVVCVPCSADFFRGEIVAEVDPSRDSCVYMSTAVFTTQETLASSELAAHASSIADSSTARWVNCPRCSAYRGDLCRAVRYCPQRIEENMLRLEALETYGVQWATPCHQASVWLIWRTTANELSWNGVPCTARNCGKTYEVRMYADDQLHERVPTERVQPDRIEMCCWALETLPL